MFKRDGIQKILIILALTWASHQVSLAKASSEDLNEPIVYGTYITLSMGNPGEDHARDYYINLGTKNGVKVGSKIEVLRRQATHDLLSRKLQKDMAFPIAFLKVIHVEQNGAIARLEKMLPEEATPAITPRAVMVGDGVRLASSR